jgi:hypothetical protein
MSDQVTELTSLVIRPDLDVETPGSEGHKLVGEINEIILNIKGLQKLTWGPQHENPRTYEWALGRVHILFPSTAYSFNATDFDCTESQKDFESSPGYAPFAEKIAAIAGGPLNVKNVHFRTPFSKVSEAPIVELTTCFVGPDADLNEVETIADRFLDIVKTNAKGFVDVSSGWTLEDIDSPDGQGKMKAFIGALGWESLEAHMTSVKSDAIREAIGPLVAAVKKLEMVSRH